MVPYELLERVVAIFERLGIPYLVTGSIAAMAYGEPRLTNAIDIVAGIAEEQIPPFVAAFPAEDYYISAAMILEAPAGHHRDAAHQWRPDRSGLHRALGRDPWAHRDLDGDSDPP